MSILNNAHPKTVDQAISGLTKSLDDLKAVAATKATEHDTHRQKANEHAAKANEHAAHAHAALSEHRRATAVHRKISELIGLSEHGTPV